MGVSRALVGIGANLGDRRQSIARALELLADDPAIASVRTSGLHATSPVGGPSGQPEYLNAAATLDTSLSPEALHALLERIETTLGRRREARWGPRPIDLDLLLYDELTLRTARLELPHPRMTFRRFVLAPSAEVAADWTHPLARLSIGQLLSHLEHAADYVALIGLPGSGKTELAKRASEIVGARFIADPFSGTPAPADPSGHELGRQIQFLDRAARVRRETFAPGGPVAISDFYFDQGRAYARVALDDARFRAFERNWAEARAAVAQPKLLVVLDEWDVAGEDRSLLRRALLAETVGKGPIWFAGPGAGPRQIDELAAALAAIG
jgi:2-amino-4-hydroxy-6-hydroxymethyldihydropteridine diphosphokinase